MTSVGVVGAGVMGTGVAQSLAQAGHTVVLVDVSDDILARSRQEIERNIRMSRMFGNEGNVTVDPEKAVRAISCATDYAPLGEVEFLIENITEDWELKRKAYRELDTICRPETVFAANTSAIPITRIAAETGRARRVVGIHFMNPVPLKRSVELIPGYFTSPDTVEQAEELLASMGKEAIIVNDSPGFVSNRVFMLTVNEAAFLVYENVASAENVDRVFKSCFGYPMGPLETADLIGVDTILRSIEVLYQSFADSKYRPCPLLRKMTDAGLHGRKAGRGFYVYGRAEGEKPR